MRLLLLLILSLIPFCLKAGQVDYTSSDSMKIVRLLDEASKMHADRNAVLYFAKKFIGCQYVAHTLEVNEEERLVVNASKLDCTTFVETVSALTICAYKKLYSFDSFCMVLRNLRYREGGINGYESRLHYFSEWITDNSQLGFVKEMQSPVPPFEGRQLIDVCFMSEHPEYYKALKSNRELTDVIGDMEKRISGSVRRFIPKSKVVNSGLMRNVVKDGDIIAITCNTKGLDIAHVGFAVWKNGKLHLLHASSKYKKVIEDPVELRTYLMRNKSFTGIRVIRILKE